MSNFSLNYSLHKPDFSWDTSNFITASIIDHNTWWVYHFSFVFCLRHNARPRIHLWEIATTVKRSLKKIVLLMEYFFCNYKNKRHMCVFWIGATIQVMSYWGKIICIFYVFFFFNLIWQISSNNWLVHQTYIYLCSIQVIFIVFFQVCINIFVCDIAG